MVLSPGLRVALAFLWLLTGPIPALAQAYGPTLSVQGNQFAVDGKPRFLFFVSFFDALREAIASPERLDEDLTYIRNTLGADGIRIFPNWWIYAETGDLTQPQWIGASQDTLFDPSNAAAPLRPSQLAALKDLLRRASALGLIVDVSFTMETLPAPGMTFEQYKAALVAAARELKEYRNALFDLQNEFDDDPRLDAAQMQALKTAVTAADADPRRLVVASPSALSPGENGAFAARHGMSAAAHHGGREKSTWHLEETLSAIVSGIRAGAGRPIPVYLQEPMPWSVNGDEDRTPGRFAAAAQHAKKAGAAAWTFHQRLTFILTSTSFKTKLEQLPDLRKEFDGVRQALQ